MQYNQQIENVGHSLFSLSQVYNDAPGIRMKISQISKSSLRDLNQVIDTTYRVS